MIPIIFFLIPVALLSADDGRQIPVFYTDDMETWCNTQGKHSACIMEYGNQLVIILMNWKSVQHEMDHINYPAAPESEINRDSDYDGITDLHDECPNEAEYYNGFQDKDGCPDMLPSTIFGKTWP